MKQFDPRAVRTAAPLGDALQPLLPPRGRVLEVASGSGQQAVFLAERFPGLTWIPSERDAAALSSIAAWREGSGLANLLPAVRLDVYELPWPVEAIDVVLAVRLAHLLDLKDLRSLFAGAIGAGSQTVIVVGPVTDRPSPALQVPEHLREWTVPVRIPVREELAEAARGVGLELAYAGTSGKDALLMFSAPRSLDARVP